jgi:hypothetical protein
MLRHLMYRLEEMHKDMQHHQACLMKCTAPEGPAKMVTQKTLRKCPAKSK